MNKQALSTEESILIAAREVFMQYGFDGASMQRIADRAGINKSLLHYYYRSKEKLFRQIFSKVFSKFIPHLGVIFTSDMSMEEKVIAFVDRYVDVFLEEPLIPIFVLQEIQKNPQHLTGLIREAGIDPDLMVSNIVGSMEKEGIKMDEPRHFLVNLIGLCVFPFVARPLVQRMLFGNDEERYRQFLLERKKEIPAFIINAMKKA